MKVENKEYYNKTSNKYDRQRTKKYFSLINELEIDTVLPFVNNKKVLEVGCGTGLILQEINKYTFEAIGIDISDKMLDISKNKNLNVLNADVNKIPFPDEYFDVVYSFKVLAHIKNIEVALKEMARVTKPNGKLFLEFYNPYSFKRLNNIFFKPKNFTRYDSLRNIKKILPKDIEYNSYRGLRSILIFKQLLNIPVISDIIYFLEKKYSYGIMGKFGGYFIVILNKKDGQ
ncbi:MAG: class I SAM-dependent methyltransferase [Patescibacteria group bacterium]|nr:class I SAM-dependent methyltransferase [Patescibacteria group bacterium]